MAVTNSEFAQRVGCSEAMASRLRNGHRLPGARLRDRITREFNLDPTEVMASYDSAVWFGSFLRIRVFESEGVKAND